MTQAVTNFYLFINKRYGNDDFQTIKNAMERTGDDVISYSEVRGFINENKTQQWGDVFLKNIDVSGVNAIWNELDKTRRGFNSSATLQVSENGSLNATEEQAMENKIALYGIVNKAIEEAMGSLGLNSDLTVSQGHDYEVKIKQNDIYYRAADELVGTVGSANINQLSANGTLGTEALKAVKKAAAEIIKEQIIEKYEQKLIDKVPNGYSLDDEDLGPVLLAKIEALVNSGNFNLNNVCQQIAYIIRGYMDSAGITNYGSYGASTEWQGSGLNSLQKARLKQEYRTALTIDKVNAGNQFNGFTDVLQTAINNFIDKEIEGLENATGDFNTLLTQAQNSINTFKNSPQFKALEHVVNITKNDSDFVKNNLNWIGLNEETIKELVKKPQFKQYIKDAYNAIMANPEGYGINNNNDLANETKINQAVMKYIQDNMDKILEETGCVKVGGNRKTKEEQTAAILYWNFYSAKTWQDNGDSHYENDDLYNYALMFVNYVLTAYANNEYVKNALEDTELEMLPLNKEGWSSDEIKDAMDIVMKAIKEHPNKTEKIKIEGDDDDDSDSDDDLDIDNLYDYITDPNNGVQNGHYYYKGKECTGDISFPMTQLGEDENSSFSSGKTRIYSATDGSSSWMSIDKHITYATANFEYFSKALLRGAIKQNPENEEKANNAADRLEAYFKAILTNVCANFSQDTNYSAQERELGTFKYTDSKGNEYEEIDLTVGSAQNSDDTKINEMRDFKDTKSSSGVYVGLETTWYNNSTDYRMFVFIDMNVMAQKFKQFFDEA